MIMKLNKRVSKSIAIALAGVTFVTPILNSVSAMEKESVQNNTESTELQDLKVNVLEDNKDHKIVEVVDGNKISKSIFDKKNNTLALEVKSGDIVIQKEFIDMNNTKEEDNEENINHNTRVRRAARPVTKKFIYSKLRYSINMKSWTITNSKGRVKKRPETKSHKEYLYKFKSAVDASRKHEIDAGLGINTA